MSSERHTERSVFPIALLALYVIVFILLGIAPYDRGTWWAENIRDRLRLSLFAAPR